MIALRLSNGYAVIPEDDGEVVHIEAGMLDDLRYAEIESSAALIDDLGVEAVLEYKNEQENAYS